MQASTLPPALLGVNLPDAGPRSRLIVAMVAALDEKSYASLSVADVVRHARVSKRTFYEHFGSREDCYLATYRAISEAMLVRIAGAVEPGKPADEQLRAATHAYLSTLEESPALTRTFFTEIQLAGVAALAARREVHQRFANLLRTLVAQERRDRDDARELSPEMAVAVVGAINELLLVRIEQDQVEHLTDLSDIVEQLLRALLLPPASAPVRPASSRPPRAT